MIPIDAEAEEILAGLAAVPASATTVFGKFVGLAVQDVATARPICDAVRARSGADVILQGKGR